MTIAETVAATQYLTFRLAEEVYALEISKVREVLDFTTVTKVPRTPVFMRGVINLRGSVVPVVDLRLKFGMSITTNTVNTCVIIAEVTIDGDRTVLGMLADSVEEVLDLYPGDIAALPSIEAKVRTEFVKGIGKREGRFMIVLDIDSVFSTEELAIVDASRQSGDSAGERP